ncbi:hypothetical protein AWZ03_009293 [Drosophila navojoa]|uniref:Uncharacterized protein n=1 Tax=Drosophila navojoa TaxID=7232 RepID=A0A484B901_DRONA|nr:hypothetical protein AWZ03_009293 [Drosophila navojoa]
MPSPAPGAIASFLVTKTLQIAPKASMAREDLRKIEVNLAVFAVNPWFELRAELFHFLCHRAMLFALVALCRTCACEFRFTASAIRYSSGTSAASSEIVLKAQLTLIALSL